MVNNVSEEESIREIIPAGNFPLDMLRLLLLDLDLLIFLLSLPLSHPCDSLSNGGIGLDALNTVTYYIHLLDRCR